MGTGLGTLPRPAVLGRRPPASVTAGSEGRLAPRSFPILGTRRDGAERYLFLVVAGFALSVAVTRVFLSLTGYPKVGGGGLHIAHMPWGGLLLVIASLLPLLLVGRRVLVLSAIAGGVGVALFIDEIGKFVTETNDYFFAPAAPLIYGAVLLLVGLWLGVRRRGQGAREALHAAIEASKDAVDGTLSRPRRDAALARLEAVRTGGDAGQVAAAGRLIASLTAPDVEAGLRPAGWVEDGGPRRLLERLLPDRLERALVVLGLLGTGLLAIFAALLLAMLLGAALPLEALNPSGGPVEFPREPGWAAATLVVAIGVGLASAVAAVLLLLGRERAGLRLGTWATLVNLVAGGLLNFYVSQFGALTSTALHLVLLGLLLDQDRRRQGNGE